MAVEVFVFIRGYDRDIEAEVDQDLRDVENNIAQPQDLILRSTPSSEADLVYWIKRGLARGRSVRASRTVFLFSGHGDRDGDQFVTQLMGEDRHPVNVRKETWMQAFTEGLQESMGNAVLLLDCCYALPFADPLMSTYLPYARGKLFARLPPQVKALLSDVHKEITDEVSQIVLSSVATEEERVFCKAYMKVHTASNHADILADAIGNDAQYNDLVACINEAFNEGPNTIPFGHAPCKWKCGGFQVDVWPFGMGLIPAQGHLEEVAGLE